MLARWLGGALAVAGLLLAAVLAIALIRGGSSWGTVDQPPFVVGGLGDVLGVLKSNLLVLALHAMACVAGFIAGSSLPLQARYHKGFQRALHERGRPIALALVVGATGFSLTMQALRLGSAAAEDAAALHVSPAVLLLGLLPHALPELVV